VVQFVPLKVETDGENWGQWAGKYSHEGNGIPIIFVIRADGEKMYGKSGGMAGEALALFMKEQLGKAGRVFSDQEFALLEKAVETAKKAIEDGDAAAAVKAFAGIKKLGALGALGSHAKLATEADELAKKLVEQGKAKLGEAKQKIAGGGEAFEGVLAVVEANRTYAALPELKNEATAAMRELNKDAATRAALEQAEALDKANGILAGPSGKTRAVGALKQIVSRWPDSAAAKQAQQQLDKIGTTAVAAETTTTKPAGGGDAASGAGGAAAEKKAASYLKMAKTFASNRPEKAREYAQKAIDLAPDSEQASEAQKLIDQLK
jgi:tetratricopeptide (TPR) repeat protein